MMLATDIGVYTKAHSTKIKLDKVADYSTARTPQTTNFTFELTSI